MALSDQDPRRGPGGKECHVHYTGTLAGAEADLFYSWIDDQSVRPDAICAIVERELGFPLQEQSVRRHRNGKCACRR